MCVCVCVFVCVFVCECIQVCVPALVHPCVCVCVFLCCVSASLCVCVCVSLSLSLSLSLLNRKVFSETCHLICSSVALRLMPDVPVCFSFQHWEVQLDLLRAKVSVRAVPQIRQCVLLVHRITTGECIKRSRVIHVVCLTRT